ncbi:MAG: hypothetical protein MK105_16350 [Crocinitomicaceae bacterium]|nr:hypothetical protein [Crocinitomicaceae bacterium]
MFVEKRFFKWNNEFYTDPVRLGEEIESLLDRGIISPHIEDGDRKYFLTTDKNIWIGESKGFVEYIYYTKSTGDKIIGVDAFDLPYPATEHICNRLSERFAPIPEIKSIREMREFHKGDFLYIIFRDFIPMNLFIIRLD